MFNILKIFPDLYSYVVNRLNKLYMFKIDRIELVVQMQHNCKTSFWAVRWY